MNHSKAENNAAAILRTGQGIVVAVKKQFLPFMFRRTPSFVFQAKRKVEEK